MYSIVQYCTYIYRKLAFKGASPMCETKYPKAFLDLLESKRPPATPPHRSKETGTPDHQTAAYHRPACRNGHWIPDFFGVSVLRSFNLFNLKLFSELSTLFSHCSEFPSFSELNWCNQSFLNWFYILPSSSNHLFHSTRNSVGHRS